MELRLGRPDIVHCSEGLGLGIPPQSKGAKYSNKIVDLNKILSGIAALRLSDAA
jgi:hypothetical protein